MTMVVCEAEKAASDGKGKLCWERAKADDMLGHHRAIAVFPLEQQTFDWLFNGRSGYRAQYYLSVEEGISFNRVLVDALLDAVRVAFDQAPPNRGFDLFQASMRGRGSKISLSDAAFREASLNELRPPIWVEKNRDPVCMGLRAPLPNEPCIDVKGGWLSDHDGREKEDPSKRYRHCDLAKSGFA
jgi:hypothetical protein